MAIRSVIKRFGGIGALARELKHKHPTTVQGWWERETIPAQQQRIVLQAARDLGLAVSAEDLMPSIKSKPST